MPYASELVALIDADTRRFDQKAANVDRALKKLASSDPEVTVTVDDTRAQADIRGVETALAGIEDETVGISADASEARSEVQTVEAALAGIEDETVGISADAAQARGEVQSVEAALAGIEDESVAVTANAAQARAEVQTVEAALAGLEDESVAVTVEGRQATAEVQTIEAALAGLEDQTVQVNVEARELSSTLAGLGTGMGGVAGSSRSMGSSLGGTAAETLALGAAVDSADGRLDMLGGRMGAVVGKVGLLRAGVVGLAGGAVVGGFTKLAMGAAELDDSLNATNVVFANSRQIINEWGEDSVRKVGLTEASFRDLVGGLGPVIRGLGATGDEVANLSNEMVSLGADFASVRGGSIQQAVESIGAAFRGETEPIRRYGIMLDAAAVQERALAMGLVDGNGKIKNRAAVVRELIVEQAEANGYVGDFEKTQREGVNAVRTMTASLGQAADELGRAFVPALVAGSNAVSDLTEDIGPLIDGAVWLGERALPAAAKGAGFLVESILGLIPGGKAARDVLDTLGAASERNAQMNSYAKGTADGYADRQAHLKDVLAQTKGPADDAADGIGGVGDAADDARAPVDKFKDALDRLIGINLSAESAQIRFEEALHTVTGSLKENTHHLDSNSAEALKARGDVVSLGEAALRTAESMTTEGATVAEVNRQLATNRQRMIDHMVQGGMTRGEADKFIGSLGFTEQNLKQVAGELGLNTDKLRTMAGASAEAKGKTDALSGALDGSGGSAWRARDAFGMYRGKLDEASGASFHARGRAEELAGSVDRSGGSAVVARDRFGAFRLGIDAVPNDKTVNTHTPGLGPALDGMGKLAGLINGIGRNVVINLKSEFGFGDGPGNIRAAGSAMARARAAATGLPVRMSSGYRSPSRNAAAGGSPTSYHMDAGNPASDWVGPTWALDELARRLRAAGGYRELLWRVPNHAPGDNPHVHYAHTGGIVEPSWGTLPGLRADERPVIAQVGEGILSRSDMAALATSGGSSAPVVGGGPTFNIVVNIPANAPDAATVGRIAYDAAKAGTAEAFAEERRRNLAMNGRR